MNWTDLLHNYQRISTEILVWATLKLSWYFYLLFESRKLHFALLCLFCEPYWTGNSFWCFQPSHLFFISNKIHRMIKCVFYLTYDYMVHQFVLQMCKLCSEQKGCLLFQHLNVVTTCKCEPSPQIWLDCSGCPEINGFLTTINSFPLCFLKVWPLKTFKILVIFHQNMQTSQASPRRVFSGISELDLICCSIHLNTF